MYAYKIPNIFKCKTIYIKSLRDNIRFIDRKIDLIYFCGNEEEFDNMCVNDKLYMTMFVIMEIKDMMITSCP